MILNIKASSYVLVCFLITVIFSACNKSFLRTDPLSFYTPENVFVDKGGFESALMTVRSNMLNEFFGNANPLMNDVNSTDVGARDLVGSGDWNRVTPSDGGFFGYVKMFTDDYTYIRNTNLIISRIDDIVWNDENDRNQILAEALFFRSYWYYRLVHSYGDVPWVGEEIRDAKIDFQTYSKWAIIDKIENDLEFAANNLPKVRDNKSQVSRYAVLQLLTKVYMENLKFDKAINATSEIIDDGPFQLMKLRFGSDANDPSRNVVWDLHRPENISSGSNLETILSVINREAAPDAARVKSYTMRNFNPTWWHSNCLDSEGAHGTTDKVNGTNTEQYKLFGRGNPNFITDNWYNYDIWDDGTTGWSSTSDLRRIEGNYVNKEDIIYNNPNSVDFGKPVDPANFANDYDSVSIIFPFPFYKTYYPEPEGFNGNVMGGYGDYYVYRLAETYLLRAEAYFWNGDLELSKNDINEVRSRSNATSITSSQVDIDYIFDERARELYIEEMRHTEMVRVSLIMAQLGEEGYTVGNLTEKNWFYDRTMRLNQFYQEGQIGNWTYKINPYNIFYPIPLAVITANTQQTINQNIGYEGASNNVDPIDHID